MTAPTSMRNHWWWRPGWSVGKRFYTCHLTFEGQDAVHRLADTYRSALAPLEPALTLIPDQWLHCTMQGIGFVDEVPEANVQSIVAGARERLAALPAFDVEIGPAFVDPEAVLMPLHPSRPVQEVREQIRAALADVLGEAPEAADGYFPHVSVAYSADDGPAGPVTEAVESVNAQSATARISSVSLIEIHRDNRMYEWRNRATLSLA